MIGTEIIASFVWQLWTLRGWIGFECIVSVELWSIRRIESEMSSFESMRIQGFKMINSFDFWWIGWIFLFMVVGAGTLIFLSDLRILKFWNDFFLFAVTIVHVIVISLVDDDTTDSLDFGNAFESACSLFSLPYNNSESWKSWSLCFGCCLLIMKLEDHLCSVSYPFLLRGLLLVDWLVFLDAWLSAMFWFKWDPYV